MYKYKTLPRPKPGTLYEVYHECSAYARCGKPGEKQFPKRYELEPGDVLLYVGQENEYVGRLLMGNGELCVLDFAHFEFFFEEKNTKQRVPKPTDLNNKTIKQ